MPPRSTAAPSAMKRAAISSVNLPSRGRPPLNLLRQAADKLASYEPDLPPPAMPSMPPSEPQRNEFEEPADFGEAADPEDRQAAPDVQPKWSSMFTPGEGNHEEYGSDPLPPPSLPEPMIAEPLHMDTKVEENTASPSPAEFWSAVQAMILNKRTAMGAAGVLTVIVLITSIGSFSGRAVAGRAEQPPVGDPEMESMDGMAPPRGLESRAALFIVDDFTEGYSDWTRPDAFEPTEGGPLRLKSGVALRRSTLGMKDARIEFEAQIERGGLGWRVRASEFGEYYEFKIDRAEGTLTRFAMVGGQADEAMVIEIPEGVLQSEGFNRIAIQIAGDRVATLINGRGVDFMTDPRLTMGGVGFVAGTGDSALIRKLTVVANDDFWGMVLRGAFDTLGSG